MAFMRNLGRFLGGVGDADGEDFLPRAQRREGAVVIAGAIADAMPAAVEGRERHEEEIGRDLGRRRGWLGIPILPSTSASPGRHSRNTSGVPRAPVIGSAVRTPASARVSSSGMVEASSRRAK